MKNQTLLLTLLSISAFVVGCNQERTTAQKNNKLQTETKEAAQERTDYTFTQKGEFTEKMQSQLAEINQELDRLAAQLEKSGEAAKTEAKPKMQALREKADQLGKQLGEARNATESTWESVKDGSKKAYGELKESFQQARQWMSEKIAP